MSCRCTPIVNIAIAADRVAPDTAGIRTGFPPRPPCGMASAEGAIMSERSNLDMLPADLVPLGIVHNDERRDDLMAAVDLAQRKGAVALWRYP